MTSVGDAATVRPRAPGDVSLFWTLFNWSWIIFFMGLGALLCVTLGPIAILFGDRQRLVAHSMLAWANRCQVRWHPTCKLFLTGVENLAGAPFILCPNHQSYADVVYIYSLPVQFRWIIKRELFWVPFFGMSMRVAGYPAISRGDVDSAQGLLDRVAGYLRAGVPVLNFPEGSRSRTGELQRFHTGAARMAILNAVPLVPVGVVGTARLLPRGSVTFPSRARVGIHIGTPIPTKGLSLDDLRSVTRQLRDAVLAAKAEAERSIYPQGNTNERPDVASWSP